MTITVNGRTITLNDDQRNALSGIKAFLEDSAKLFCCLSGAAGTGKSTIIKEAISGRRRVAVTAPTHKAKKVVGQFTGRGAQTLHYLLGLRPDMSLEAFDKHNLLFTQMSRGSMGDYSVVIVDECSMINRDLDELIKRNAIKCNTKVIYLGDPYQLTPVKKKKEERSGTYDWEEGPETNISPVFTDEDTLHLQLTKVERQQDSNPLMFVYDKIRADINSLEDQFEHQTIIHGDEGIKFYDRPEEFAQHLLTTFREKNIAAWPYNAKMLCWRNDTIRRWNNYVRKNLYGNIKEPIQEGEVMMGYKNIRREGDEKGLLVQNSSEYVVTGIRDNVHGAISGWEVKLRDVDNPANEESAVFIVRPDEGNYLRFLAKEQYYLERAKKADPAVRANMWRQYYNFKNRYLLMEKLVSKAGTVLVDKDIDYAYVLSVHRAQGSSYKYVFIDENDLNANSDHTERNRLKYVALSRPTNIAHILNY